MRRIVSDDEPSPSPPPQQTVIVPHDPVNEAAVVAAGASDPEVLKKLLRRIRADHFLVRENASAWAVLEEISRRGLDFDMMVVEKLGGSDVSNYIAGLLEGSTESINVEWHVSNLLWDFSRANAARGPLASFLEALKDPKAEPERVRALARSLAQSFDGHADRRYLRDPAALVHSQMIEIEKRASGRATFPYGIRGLDYYDDSDRRRMIPGTAPGKMTVVTGVSGGGKSTFTGHIALGLAGFHRENDVFLVEPIFRPVLFGAWEMESGITLEVLACISLCWSRTELSEGRGPSATHEGRVILEERMHLLAQRIRFMDNPFWKTRGEKPSNEKNLDLIQGYIADSGAEIFIADLWKRCLVDDQPSAEEQALIRQQAMLEELRVHGIMLQQQRLKDVELRQDKRPTRDGIKGSGAWVEVPDTVIAPHRPALWKKMDDDKLEICILKQRYGKWPVAIEFDWNPDTGQIWGGREIEYDRPGEVSDFDQSVSATAGHRGGFKGHRRM